MTASTASETAAFLDTPKAFLSDIQPATSVEDAEQGWLPAMQAALDASIDSMRAQLKEKCARDAKAGIDPAQVEGLAKVFFDYYSNGFFDGMAAFAKYMGGTIENLVPGIDEEEESKGNAAD